MWGLFAFGIIICMLFVYLPGFFIFKSLRYSSYLSVTLAPCASISEYGLLCLIFESIEMQTSFVSLFLASLLISLVIFGTALYLGKGNLAFKAPYKHKNHQWSNLLLYIGVAVIITGYFFVKTLDGPDSFILNNDATTHLYNIRHFTETGNWSILASGSYYPQGYSELSAMLSQALGVNAPFAANILVTTLLSVVLPSSMLGFFCFLFKGNTPLIRCGSIAVLAFAGFPWFFLESNQIGPNLLGFSLLPQGLMIILIAFRCFKNKQTKIAPLVSFGIFTFSCVFTHPNTLFTLGVMLVPYCIYQIIVSDNKVHGVSTFLSKPTLILLFLLAVLAIWITCYNLPMLSSIVSFNWGPNPAESPEYTIKTLLTYSYKNPAQFFVIFLMLFGLFYAFIHREYLWIPVSILLLFFIFYAALACNGFLRQFISGFWYTAGRRIYGAICIASIPLVTMGIYLILNMLHGVLKPVCKEKKSYKTISSILVTILITITIFVPSFTLPAPTGAITTTFGYIYSSLEADNKSDNSILDQEERNFLSKVKDIVGNSKVFNLPFDGSAFAYALNGININLHHFQTNSSENGILLQKKLNEIGLNPDVKNAAKDSEIEYVLYLDSALDEGSSAFTSMVDPELWDGYLKVNDNTPGLELVLSDGDMRLYKIEDTSKN